jgi:hypothetical protein
VWTTKDQEWLLWSDIPYYCGDSSKALSSLAEDVMMLDHPEKTTRLLAALKAAAPFEVELLPSLIDHLATDELKRHPPGKRAAKAAHGGQKHCLP